MMELSTLFLLFVINVPTTQHLYIAECNNHADQEYSRWELNIKSLILLFNQNLNSFSQKMSVSFKFVNQT